MSPSYADSEIEGKYEDFRYGNCYVLDWRGKTNAIVWCGKSKYPFAFTGKYVWLTCGLPGEGNTVELGTGLLSTYDFVTESGNWKYFGNSATNYTYSTFNDFAAGLRTATTLVFEVGSPRFHLSLKGSTEVTTQPTPKVAFLGSIGTRYP